MVCGLEVTLLVREGVVVASLHPSLML
ncbi:hypothetical protein HaLaN_14017 [Haematococcus lacustris]|uniref:Uncharacterized protein n=1 Tax=Haematococcus lacustris TaxID=44745 RepID=A0A699ZES9_HAELA|nr:hypothetical protein HaLaN_14017 [Haematococcus lacustris]